MNNTLIAALAERPDWYRIEDDAVVTHDKAGNAASLFGDDAWDIRAYTIGSRRTHIHFRGHPLNDVGRILSDTTTRQWKQVMYFLMHEVTETVPASSTLQSCSFYLKDFTFFAAERQLTLYEGLSNVAVVLDYVEQAGMDMKAQRLHSILAKLHRLGAEATGLRVPLTQLHKPLLERSAQRAGNSQYAVIQTRIYQHFLSTCEHDLGIAESVGNALSDYLARAYAGESPDVCAALKTAAVHFGCKDSLYVVSSLVAKISALCQLVILSFTGMRAMEAQNLPYHCLSETRLDGVTHYAIEGVTTKLSGGRPKHACWVTSPLGARAVRLAQRLSAEDIAELKRVDMHRAWEDEPKYTVGQQWPFTRHQLRRSLALYAQRSGLVTLPTLKRQLQHITQEMSMYYARGSAFAKGFIDTDKAHFAKEWAEAQGLSEYLAYAEQVLFSDERLFGGHAAWTQSRAVQASPVSVYSREQTVRMFGKGELAYRETVLGGCASVEPCKSTPLDWMRLDCLESNCRNLVVMPSKLQRVIKAQQATVEKLRAVDEASVESRIEAQTLQRLLDAQEKLMKPEAA